MSDLEKDSKNENEPVEITITRKDVRKRLVFGIIFVVGIAVFCFLWAIITQKYIQYIGGAILVAGFGVVFVRLYLVNPEALYGITIGRKIRKIANPDVRYGYRLGKWFLVIFLILFLIVLDIIEALV